MGIGPGTVALIYFIAGLWLVAFVLYLANVCLTFFAESSSSFKVVNVQILGVYTFLAFLLFTCCIFFSSIVQDHLLFVAACTLVFLIPLMVIIHFICLLVSVRRRRRKLENVSVVDVKEKQTNN